MQYDPLRRGCKGTNMYRKYIKRVLDILFGIIGFPFFAIIFIVVAPIIKLEDRGPVFYNAGRLGKDTKVFKMYKFRSMKVNAPDIRNEDGSTFNSETDPRVTKIGRILRKLSIDETPQLINVIKGDMSFVGPRPGLPLDWEHFSDEEKRRRTVRPGITGYSQAYYRNSDTMEKRMDNDVNYAEHVSFLLDCKILLKTVESVIRKENVNRND